MRRLTQEEKEKLQAMIDKQSEEQKKKRRRYINHKLMVRTASFCQDTDQRLEKLEKKYEKSQMEPRI